MKLKKTKKDIIESIKSVSSKKKNEMFEVDSKVQAVATPSFVDALEMSAKNKQMVIDRMKEKEKEKKEFMKQTVERTANTTPKSDDMKKMKMVEEFINESFKDKLTINENIFTVTTKLRTELKKLIENARKNEVKYTIERINEEYRFNYKFESLNKKINEDVSQDEKIADLKKQGFTERGANLAVKAFDTSFGDFYDAHVGTFGPFNSKEFKQFKTELNKWCDEHGDFGIIKFTGEEFDIYLDSGFDNLSAEDGVAYWCTSVWDNGYEDTKDVKVIRQPKLDESKKINEERKYVAGFFSKGKKDSYTEMSGEKWNSLDSDVKVKDLLDMWWNSVRIKGNGIKGEALLYKDCHDGSYELDEEHNSHGEDILNMTVHTHYEYDEDGDDYPIIYAKLLSKEVKESVKSAYASGDMFETYEEFVKIDKNKTETIATKTIQESELAKEIGIKSIKELFTAFEQDGGNDDVDALFLEVIQALDEEFNTRIYEGYLKEEKALTTSKFKDFIRDHFDYSFDFEFLDIVAHILDRINFEEDLDDEIDVAINDSLVYDEDQWTVAKFYASSPADLDWDEVLNDLSNDIHAIAKEIVETKEDEEDEE